MTGQPGRLEKFLAACRRHPYRAALGAIASLFVILVGFAAIVGSHSQQGQHQQISQAAATSAPPALSESSQAVPAPSVTDPNGQTCTALDSTGYCPGDDPSPSPPAPTMTKQTDVIVFKVWGSGLPSVQYGSDSTTNNPGSAGSLGDGNYLPWEASMPYDPNALYYAVDAQLEGSGSIQDSVTEVVETWCSNGTNNTESFPEAQGSANGGYGIAMAEFTDATQDGNAAQAESDAGC
jgi:hypothetical protein